MVQYDNKNAYHIYQMIMKQELQAIYYNIILSQLKIVHLHQSVFRVAPINYSRQNPLLQGHQWYLPSSGTACLLRIQLSFPF